MMDFENFVEYVKNLVHQYLPEELQNTEIRIIEVNKNNNLHLTGIIIVDPYSKVSPTIYLNDIFSRYEDGSFSANECVKCVANRYLECELRNQHS